MSRANLAGIAALARRAPGGPPKAEPGADAGPAAPQAPRLFQIRVAVGTAGGPPHRSQRAGLPRTSRRTGERQDAGAPDSPRKTPRAGIGPENRFTAIARGSRLRKSAPGGGRPGGRDGHAVAAQAEDLGRTPCRPG